MSWLLLDNGNYVNLAAVVNLYPVNIGGGVYKVRCNPGAGADIEGISEASEAAARDAIRRLVHGVSATEIT